MLCGKCGSPVRGDEKFCGKCGTAIENTSEAKSSPKSNSAKAGVVLYSVGIVLFVLAAIDYAGMYFDYDITGVSWSPYAIGVIGGMFTFVAKKFNPSSAEDND